MVEIKEYSPVDHYLKCLIYWAPGTGKTFFAAWAKNVLVGSAEAGLLWIKSWVNYAQIKSFKDLQELFIILEEWKHKYDTFVLDSVTEVNDIIINELSADKWQMYQNDRWTLGKKLMDMFRKFRDLPMNIIFVCHEQPINDEERIVKYIPMISGKTWAKAPGLFDVVGRTYVNDKWEFKIRVEPTDKLVTKSRGAYITNETPSNFEARLATFQDVEVKKEVTVMKVETVEDYIQIATTAGISKELLPRAEKTYKYLASQSIDDLELQSWKVKTDIEWAPEGTFSDEEKEAYYKFIDLSCSFLKNVWLT